MNASTSTVASLNSVLTRSFASALLADDNQRVSGVTRLVSTAKQLSPANVTGRSRRAALLDHLRAKVGQVVNGNELFAVAGTSEYGRRVRELRANGWQIFCGANRPTRGEVRMMARHGLRSARLAKNDYVLLSLRNTVSHRS